MIDQITFTVHGRPQQRGSKRPFLIRGGGGVSPRIAVTDDNKHSAAWMDSVRGAAIASLPASHRPIDTPIRLTIDFYFSRPKSHYRTGKNAHLLRDGTSDVHAQKPDLDKLTRAIGDALTGIVYRDDSLICQIIARKHWTCGMDRAEIAVETAIDHPPAI